MNVSSVKNLNGETFSAVQDTALTNIVSSNSANWNEISAYQANSGNYLTAVPVGTMNESAFSYDANDKISGYNGSAFAGGSDVPEGVMVESGLEYDNTEISGYSGSAFKDVALTDVVTANSGAWGGSALPISAGEGVKVEYVDGTVVFKQDRTLLYSGNTSVTGFTASEPLTNFERVEFIVSPDPNNEGPSIITYPMINLNTARLNLGWVGNFDGWRNISWNYLFNTNDNIVYTAKSGSYFGLNVNGATAQGIWGSAALWLFEINGINRKV